MAAISEQHKKEFDRLRKRGRLIKSLFLLTIFLLAFYPAFMSPGPDIDSIETARGKLIASNFPLSAELVQDYYKYSEWIDSYFGIVEDLLFDRAARNILGACAHRFEKDRSPTFLRRFYVHFYFALLRIAFLLIVSVRTWCLACIIGALWSLRRLKLHRGNDILGELGNQRLYFSGVRLSLDQVDSDGVPQMQATGLACPQKVSLAETKSSRLTQILEQYKTANDINIELASIIVAAQKLPCYVPGREEAQTLDSYIEATDLLTGASAVLDQILEIHQKLTLNPETNFSGLSIQHNATNQPVYSADTYAHELALACARVLTFNQRQAIAEISPTHIATLTLSVIAGRILTYGQDAERWIQRSQYPHLCARAILHSVSSFGKQYTPIERTVIRQALVYAARRSAFAPVRLPINFPQARLALRQWAELLICSPHELLVRADEVELFGLIQELHAAWANKFIDSIALEESALSQSLFVPDNSNLFFVPLSAVLDSLTSIISAAHINRLDELMARVSQVQRVRLLAAENKEDGHTSSEQNSLDRIMSPLTNTELNDLSSLHNISVDNLKKWSALRLVLNSFGWLARRVGDYSVPESSVIFGVFKVGSQSPSANEFGFMGQKGMLALRATRLVERFGRGWKYRFILVESASMAESILDYQKRLRGVVDNPQDEFIGGNA